MAIDRAIRNQGNGGSIYDERDSNIGMINEKCKILINALY